MNAISDSALLDQWVRSRDAVSFREITLRHAGMVYATCKRILGDPLDAEDVAQECFLALAQTRDAIQSLPGWLHTLAVRRSWNAVRDEKRRRAREMRYAQETPREVPSPVAAVGANTEWKTLQQRIDESIVELPDDLRETIIAYFLEGRSQAEIAAHHAVNQATVSRRVTRGIELVRTSLNKKNLGVSVAALSAMLEAHAVETAPMTLVSALGRLALTAAHASPAPMAVATGILAHKGILAAVGIVVASLAGIGVIAHERASEPRTTVSTPEAAPAPRAEKSRDVQALSTAPESVEPPAPAQAAAPPSAAPAPATESARFAQNTEPAPAKGKAVLSGRVILRKDAGGNTVWDAFNYVKFIAREWTGFSSAGGTKVLLSTLDAAHQYETEVVTDGSFSLAGLPGGTYFITLAPQDETAIDSNYGGWRLIDLGEEELRQHVLLMLYRWKDPVSGTEHASMDVPMLETGQKWYDLFGETETPTWSSLSPEERQQADADYAVQHDAWLSVRTVSASYRWTTRWMEHGEWVQRSQAAPRTGTLAYEILPLTQEEAKARGRGLQMQQRWNAYDNELKCRAVSDDLFGPGAKVTYYLDGRSSSKQPQQGMLPHYLFRDIPSLMAMSYQDPHWNDTRLTREEFLNKVTPAMRLSTENERETLLGGQSCFMFLAYLAQPRVWISTATGRIHQFDRWEPQRPVMGYCRYERYYEDKESGLSFPSRIVYTSMEGLDGERKGNEQAIELSDLRINPQLPPETFQAE